MRAAIVGLSVAACSPGCYGSPRSGEASTASQDQQVLVVTGRDGVAVAAGGRLKRQPGLDASDFAFGSGAVAAPLPEGGAAVVTGQRAAIVRADHPAVVANCAECSGVAVTSNYIVTTRRNYSPGQGFDIVLFDRHMKVVKSVATERITERTSTDYPAENTESPVTLAADKSRVTVGYLSRAGGIRQGPSVIAQYGYDGKLFDSVQVDGIIGRSAPSADGKYLAVGVGGSGGACITISEPAVIDLDGLRVRPLEPELPVGAKVDPSSLSGAWFLLTDLVWQGDTLTATGQVHAPPPTDTCDNAPTVWTRTFDATTGHLQDAGPQQETAVRWVGPGCADVMVVRQTADGPQLVSRSSGPERVLGRYDGMSPGQALPPKC